MGALRKLLGAGPAGHAVKSADIAEVATCHVLGFRVSPRAHAVSTASRRDDTRPSVITSPGAAQRGLTVVIIKPGRRNALCLIAAQHLIIRAEGLTISLVPAEIGAAETLVADAVRQVDDLKAGLAVAAELGPHRAAIPSIVLVGLAVQRHVTDLIAQPGGIDARIFEAADQLPLCALSDLTVAAIKVGLRAMKLGLTCAIAQERFVYADKRRAPMDLPFGTAVPLVPCVVLTAERLLAFAVS